MANGFQTGQEIKEERLRRVRRRRFLVWALWIAGVLIAVSFLGWLAWVAKEKSANLPGTPYPAVGRDHIGLDDEPPQPYNSNPPSSGGHYASPATWGIYDYEVDDKIFIHNLEHGGIWIAYHPSTTPAVVDELEAIVRELGTAKIVMAPRSANDADIAVVSWGWVQKFNLEGSRLADTEREAIRTFYRKHRDHGPEFVPDTMPGIDPKTVQ